MFEIKLSKAPKSSRGFYQLIEDIKPDSATVGDRAHRRALRVQCRGLGDGPWLGDRKLAMTPSAWRSETVSKTAARSRPP
ncbi:MAG: hypothetical protein VBE63_26400, partial [Lamprobacter sp.]|nr:hypothetical protein [Lamprobacter sp.]